MHTFHLIRSRGASQGGLQARSPQRMIPFRILPCLCRWGRIPLTSWAKASSRRMWEHARQWLDIMGQSLQQTSVGACPAVACDIMRQALEQTNVGACPIRASGRHYHNSDWHARICFREGAFGQRRRLACPLADACSYGCLASARDTLSEGVERAVHRGNSGVFRRFT